MNGGFVPLVLLSATIGLLLALVATRLAVLALAAFALAALMGWAIPFGLSPQFIFTALWLSTMVAAILVYVPILQRAPTVLPLVVNAGFWLGACAALSIESSALGVGLAPILIAIPATWLTRHKFDIIIKVVASWMIAIASLSLFVSLIPTPGYKPDHME